MALRKKISIVLILISLNAWSQGESNIWYFGFNAGLNFNTNPPTPLTDGLLSTYEGCASIADKNGNLIFYTDGTTVWNKTHAVMTNGNGLLGNNSSTQAAIIVPYPGTYNYAYKRFDKYFIVTVDYCLGTSGICYSEVDMSISGGLGGITASKNVYLGGTTTSEKVCVVQHSNNCDFWVVTKPVGNPNYNAYLISASGFNTSPILSPVGPSVNNSIGSLKSSPNSKIISATHGDTPNGLYVYDFDNTTGILTSKFSDVSIDGYCYSQEYSPNNNFIYLTALNNSNIYQYDLNAVDNNTFLASRQVVGTTSNTVGYKMCALQLGPDKKIYASLQGLTKLGVINNPNALGTACNYVDMQQDLGGKTGQLGLPAIVTGLIQPVNKIILNDTCIKTSVVFNLLDTSNIISYNWDVFSLNNPTLSIESSNAPTISKNFDSTGYYIVRAINQYSCMIDTVTDTVRIFPVPSIAITSSNITCKGLNNGTISITELDTNTPYVYLWNNTQTTSALNNLSPGNYVVSVTNSKGCTLQDSILITEPQAELAVDSVSIQHVDCFGNASGSAALFVNGGTPPYSFSWNTTPVQITAQVMNIPQGNYTYIVSDSNNCTTSATIAINEPTLLNLNVSNTISLCEGASGTINSIISGGIGPYSYSWVPGNITTSNITLSPIATTNYTLTVTDQNNCIKKDSASIVVNPNPIVNFGVYPVCAGETSVFHDSTFISSGAIDTYNWTFGIGSSGSIQQNPTYIYPNCNVYTVSLTTISDSGCISSNTKPITVHCKPTAGFTIDDICVSELAVYSNTTVGASIFDWDFESDGTIDDTTNSPLHTFLVGNYTTTLIVTTESGCKDTTSSPINVFSAPIADFTSNNVCLGNATDFINLTTINAPDTISSWLWELDLNVFSTISDPTNIFSLAGTYPVSLKTISSNGCIDSVTKNIDVYFLPNAAYTTSNVCDGSPFIFNNLSNIEGNDSIVSWNWNWGDLSSNSFEQNPSHTYSTSGTYLVKLNVVSNNGCVDSTNSTVVVNPNPRTYFTASTNTGCTPLCIVFTDSSNILSGNIVHWNWTLGNGDIIDNLESFEYCYNNLSNTLTSSFTPILTVVSDSGCVDTLIKTDFITIYPKPIADFSLSPETTSIINPKVEVKNYSIGGDSWMWHWGDSNTNTQITPQAHVYKDTGIYTVQLIATNNYGCADTAFKQVVIEQDFLFFIPNAFSPNEDGINDSFIGKGWGIKEFEMQIYDRWGSLIYETNDIYKPWNGAFENSTEIVKQDVFVYNILVVDFKNIKHCYIGKVTLIK